MNNHLNVTNTEITIQVETMQIACDFYERTCYYRNGELLRCTEWTCGYRMDPVIIKA